MASRVFVYNAASFRGPVPLIGPRPVLSKAKEICFSTKQKRIPCFARNDGSRTGL